MEEYIKSIKSRGWSRLQEIYSILDIIISNYKGERKRLGQVFTPLELAKDMVNLIDKYDDDFWKNPNHKVLDSSAGFGTFLILAAYKFMNGLKEWEPDEEKRFKWIVENCLYYGDIDPKSVFLWLCLIDPYDEYETNTYWGDFLSVDFDRHAKEVWGIDNWQAIIQNPPYQKRRDGDRKTHPLWHLFVQKSINLLEDGGYMVMVHPSGWRNVDGVFKETQNILKSKQILELQIQNEKEGLRVFGAETRFDYYILENKKYYRSTNIKDQEGEINEIDISKMEFIPNGQFEIIGKLLANGLENKVYTIHSYSSYETRKPWVSKNKNETFKYPVVYTVPKGDTLNLMYSSRNDRGHFGLTKLIWSNGRITSVGSVIDSKGEYGLTQFSYAIVDTPENLPYIKSAFDSKEFRKIMELCSVGDMSINRKVIATFRKDFWKEFI